MVIIFDSTTKQILEVENGVMIPTIPITANNTLDEKRTTLSQQGRDFVSVPYEMDYQVFNYNLCFDSNGAFVGLQPKAPFKKE